ncbi:26443_t:CDS:1 [Dentiscutata erythropus]|uniref:26443_t:CDS:1 n=1 Tax=Dentiscutata erythropus TaxID=1348616 RepID=A0A9N9EZ54_9GLOM|nr:26443_t:CDS:1 [Dentiscutata erythropus]
MKSTVIFFTLCFLFSVFATISAYPQKRGAVGEWRVARATLMRSMLYKRDGDTNSTDDSSAGGLEYDGPSVEATYNPGNSDNSDNQGNADGGNSDNLSLANNTNTPDFSDRKKTGSSSSGGSHSSGGSSSSGGQTTGSSVGAKITFYEGSTLENAFCYGNGKLPSYNAKSTDMIGAMKMSGTSMCYKCVQILCGSNSVVVKIIDRCATCGSSQDIDLTKAAFTKLAPAVKGIVSITWRLLKTCPGDGDWPTLEDDK